VGIRSRDLVIGARIRPMAARYASSPTPRCARRALSNTAKVSQAWSTSCAVSIGSGGDSHGYGRFGGSERVRKPFAALLVRPLRRERFRTRDQREVQLASEHSSPSRSQLLRRRYADPE